MALTPNVEPRYWLGFFLLISVFLTPLFPILTFGIAVVFATIIFLYLYHAPASRGLGNFLRVSPDRPVRRALKLTSFGFIVFILIGLSASQYSRQREEAQLALKTAADEAVRARAVEAANAQVSLLVDSAKSALTAGSLDKTEQILNEASKINQAQNLVLVKNFQTIIQDANDRSRTLSLLEGLSDSDFVAFKTSGVVPKSFSSGYNILTNRIVADAQAQLGDAEATRAEIQKKVEEKAAADQLAAAAKEGERKQAEKIAAEKIEADRLAALKKQQEKDAQIKLLSANLISNLDEVDSITWYRHKFSPDSNVSNALWAYIGKKNGEVWLRMKITYTGSDWLFINGFTFNIDGSNYPVSLDWGDRKSDNSAGQVWEWVDLMVDAQGYALLEKIRDSKRTIIRYQGDQYKFDRDISTEEKQAIKEVLLAYEAMGGLPSK